MLLELLGREAAALRHRLLQVAGEVQTGLTLLRRNRLFAEPFVDRCSRPRRELSVT